MIVLTFEWYRVTKKYTTTDSNDYRRRISNNSGPQTRLGPMIKDHRLGKKINFNYEFFLEFGIIMYL